jgi:hypothetical protein
MFQSTEVQYQGTKNKKVYAVLFDTCSLMMIPCGMKHAGIFRITIRSKHLRKNIVHFVG